MKAIVLALFIAFSGSFASATCALVGGSSFVDHEGDHKAAPRKGNILETSVAQTGSNNPAVAANADKN
ncbi:MAG: hypothetical protein JNL11_14345 [Bdellovibrionaceae bacterium]|nr:hypothetical protein [Pseudobdellovibrionaceae bacterium]